MKLITAALAPSERHHFDFVHIDSTAGIIAKRRAIMTSPTGRRKYR
ncbi:MAG: hypothetical protein AB1704_30140 [Pseudomonadota bacterium]|jgi:hypothetical protein